MQVFYPDDYNGCFAACPDPIDFRAYTAVNIYEDDNAYFDEGPFGRVPRPGHRNYLGHLQGLLIDYNHLELSWATRTAPAINTTSGKRCTHRWVPTAIRSRCGTR